MIYLSGITRIFSIRVLFILLDLICFQHIFSQTTKYDNNIAFDNVFSVSDYFVRNNYQLYYNIGDLTTDIWLTESYVLSSGFLVTNNIAGEFTNDSIYIPKIDVSVYYFKNENKAVFVTRGLKTFDRITYSFYDITGTLLMHGDIDQSFFKVDVGHFRKGLYILALRNQKATLYIDKLLIY